MTSARPAQVLLGLRRPTACGRSRRVASSPLATTGAGRSTRCRAACPGRSGRPQRVGRARDSSHTAVRSTTCRAPSPAGCATVARRPTTPEPSRIPAGTALPQSTPRPPATSLPHSSTSAAMPASARCLTSSFRCLTAMSSVHAAWTTGAKAVGTTNTVRRMPSIRISVRSSYRARSVAATSLPGTRAAMDRCTVAGSVACRTTIDCAASTGSAARTDRASRCLRPSLARRSATEIRSIPAPPEVCWSPVLTITFRHRCPQRRAATARSGLGTG